jgi:hypothetical protein
MLKKSERGGPEVEQPLLSPDNLTLISFVLAFYLLSKSIPFPNPVFIPAHYGRLHAQEIRARGPEVEQPLFSPDGQRAFLHARGDGSHSAQQIDQPPQHHHRCYLRCFWLSGWSYPFFKYMEK